MKRLNGKKLPSALKRPKHSVFSRASSVFSWLKTLWWTHGLSVYKSNFEWAL